MQPSPYHRRRWWLATVALALVALGGWLNAAERPTLGRVLWAAGTSALAANTLVRARRGGPAL